MTIVAPHIFGIYENGKQLKIFVTIYYKRFKLYGNTLSENGGGIVPAAIVYNKNDNGGYILREYIEAKDGTEFNKSIREFCKPRNDMAEAIIKHYGNYQDLFVTMKKNLIIYLYTNGMKDVNIKQSDGKTIPLIQEG